MDQQELLSLIRKAKNKNWDELDLSKYRIASLPPEIGELKNLGVLDVSKTGLSTLPNEIGQLTGLRFLKASDNSLFGLPKKIGQFKNLMVFNLSHNYLTAIPPEFGWLTNLRELNLSGNQLTSLPPEIGQLTSLRVLDVSENRLTSLPKEIGRLKNLISLNLSQNMLTNIPLEIGWLKNLKELDLGVNQITSLPAEIGQLIQLTELGLRFNRLNILPAEIGQLTQLTKLNLWGNLLSALPAEIGQLTELTELDLQANLLSTLPAEIQKLNKLKGLYLQGNPLPIPPEILGKDGEPQTILNYYFSYPQQQNKKPLNEIKLIVVGQGSVGKTSLIGRIIDNRFDPAENKTEGIAINKWTIDDGRQTIETKSPPAVNSQSQIVNPKSKIALNIWDFGGQEIMHATHQFFLTKRSLYLLVLDARLTQEENRVEYWLKIIQSFGGESPVLIVGNKTDQHPLDIDRTGLQKKYANIVGVFETSAATGAGIAALRDEIAAQVQVLPHVRDLLSETWFTVKVRLESLGRERNFITPDDYRKLCSENEVADALSQRTLIGFLHDLGVVLHFQDDARLAALGILNPQWVTNGVYRILNWQPLFHNKGVLTLEMLNQALDLPEYPRDKRLFIVDMMKKFELCYDIPYGYNVQTDQSFLVPDLLPKDEPETGDWSHALAFEYRYEVLPSSIITRFVVRMSAFIDQIVWRSGVTLKNGSSTALVKADFEDRKVSIWVGGEEHKRRDFLAKIRGEFDAIHATIIKIEAREMIPVPGHPEAEPVDFDLLLQMDAGGVERYPVLAAGRMIVVDVREMLNGIESEATRRQREREGNVTNIYVGRDMVGNMVVGDENDVKDEG